MSVFGQLLGSSDVDMIRDQQMLLNKLDSSIEQKLLGGGSYVTLPKGLQIKRTDEQLKVIELKDPAQKKHDRRADGAAGYFQGHGLRGGDLSGDAQPDRHNRFIPGAQGRDRDERHGKGVRRRADRGPPRKPQGDEERAHMRTCLR